MEKHQHLSLPLFIGNAERKKRGGGGGYKMPQDRSKHQFARQAQDNAKDISSSIGYLKKKLPQIDPSLIFEIEINQGLLLESFDKSLASMNIHILSIAEDKKGYWVVFSEDHELKHFRRKLEVYGSTSGPNYDFFHAIESFRDIPVVKKIGSRLAGAPLTDQADFIDLELWKMTDPWKNENFIEQLRQSYTDYNQFRITDTLTTKSFVLLRVKLTKTIFDEIIQLKEVARVDRPFSVQFDPYEATRPSMEGIKTSPPDPDSAGILVVDSGIISNHPMLENCTGGEENFQSGEPAVQDTTGHGTAVAGCSAYGDIERCLQEKNFTASNWIFSAKVMYAEQSIGDSVFAKYDPEKLLEHQFKDAVVSFVSDPSLNVKIINISFGNVNEIFHKSYSRQLPLAALTDELAYAYPGVVFLVAAGNQSPLNIYDSIADVVDNYPVYLLDNDDFRLINPASSALAISVGSIAGEKRITKPHFGLEDIKVSIADAHQPSPFTRTGLGINGMIKPELVEYGGNLILSEQHGYISEDKGGKLALLNNSVTGDIIQFSSGTSFSTPKVAHLAGKIANQFPNKSANFLKNLLLVGADYPFQPTKKFYSQESKAKAEKCHLSVCGYGLSDYDRAIHSFDNRVVLLEEGKIGLNEVKIFSLSLPKLFFSQKGRKRITVTLTFTPETRATRGDSYLGNRMTFHLFTDVSPQMLLDRYAVIADAGEQTDTPDDFKKYEIPLFPGSNTRKAGCHQKAWKTYKRPTKSLPSSPISLVLLNFNKWILDETRKTDYCVSVTFEHEEEIELYAHLRASALARARIRK